MEAFSRALSNRLRLLPDISSQSSDSLSSAGSIFSELTTAALSGLLVMVSW